jgi:hypothetical protein
MMEWLEVFFSKAFLILKMSAAQSNFVVSTSADSADNDLIRLWSAN